MRFGRGFILWGGGMAAFQDTRATLQRQKGRTDKTTKHGLGAVCAGLGRSEFVCASKHRCYEFNAPCGWSTMNPALTRGTFVHFLKTQRDKEGAKTRERPFTPLPE